jgi:hypothetical protein
MTARKGQDWYDPARGTQARCDFDDVLRHALHAAADAIEPADDGLTRIMRRLTTPSAVRQVALLVTDCIDLSQLITIWLEPAFMGVMRLRRRHRTGSRRGVSHRATGAPSRPAAPWLRPALAVVGAAAIVVTGVFVLGPGRQLVIRTSANTGTGASTPAQAGAHSAGVGHGQSHCQPQADGSRSARNRICPCGAPYAEVQPHDRAIRVTCCQSQPEHRADAHAWQGQSRTSEASPGQDEIASPRAHATRKFVTKRPNLWIPPGGCMLT